MATTTNEGTTAMNVNSITDFTEQITDQHPAYTGIDAPQTTWEWKKVDAGCYRLTTDDRWNVVIWKDKYHWDFPWHYVVVHPTGEVY